MTIKEFSNLCGCNPQTIRYYDRMNLLKPVKVDDWTGYRYYDEDQALDYVKIKNLQTAGFTIDEIKELLCADDETIYDAFSKKINEQEKLLQRMIEIRQSYQREFTMMKNKIMELHKSIKGSMESYSPAEEFGINSKEYDEIVKNLDSYFDEMLESEDYSKYEILDHSEETEKKAEQDFKDCLSNPDLETVYECHEWKNVKEFFGDIPELIDGKEYFFLLKLEAEKINNTAFANTLLGILCLKNKNKKMSLKCNVIHSDNDKNHFWMLKKKSDGGK